MQSPFQIVHDQWLTGFFDFDVFKLNINKPRAFRRKEFVRALEGISNKGSVFIYTRIPVEAIDCIHGLEDIGFRIIDTNIVFKKSIDRNGYQRRIEGIRFARVEDRESVGEIARTAFKYSRFHLDPSIADVISDDIKAQWAMNYFNDDRGDEMVVSEKDGQIRGFLQLIYDGDNLVIDLIAVSKDYQNKNIAKEMINFAESNLNGFKEIRGGTQVANIPSIRLYEKLGFRVSDTKYLLHYHKR